MAELGQPPQRRRRRQPARQERHQAHRHQQRAGERQQDRQRHDLDQRAGERVVEVGERQGQEDDGGGDAGGHDRPHRAPDAGDRGVVGAGAVLELPLHRLVDHHAVVHQETDAHREPDQGDEVERLPSHVEQRHRHQQAHRHRHRHHRHRAPLAQEEVEHGEGDQKAREGERLEALDLVLHDVGGVDGDVEVEAQGPVLLFQRVHLAAQGAAQAHQVGALFLEHEEAHGALAVDAVEEAFASRPGVDLGDVAQLDGAAGHHAKAAQGNHAPGPSVEDHGGAPRLVLDAAEKGQAADRALERGDHLLGRDAHGGAAVGVHAHGDLASRGPESEHLGDAGDRGEPRRDVLLHEVEEGEAVFHARHLDHHDEAAQHRGRHRLHAHEGAAGLAPGHLGGDLLQLELPHLEVGAALEAHPEAAARAAHLAPGLGHQRQLGHPSLERQQDLALHHLGLARRPGERHVELVAGQIRRQLHRDAEKGDQTHDHHPEEEHRGGDGTADGESQGAHRAPSA